MRVRRAKALLPSFQRMGKVSGVVDYVLSGHRLKVPPLGMPCVYSEASCERSEKFVDLSAGVKIRGAR